MSAAADELQKIVNQGNENIRAMMAQNEKMFQQHLAQTTNGANGVELDLSTFDQDLKDAFNLYSGKPTMQLVITNIQLNRRATTIQLLVQAVGARLVNMAMPETDKALASSGASVTPEAAATK